MGLLSKALLEKEMWLNSGLLEAISVGKVTILWLFTSTKLWPILSLAVGFNALSCTPML